MAETNYSTDVIRRDMLDEEHDKVFKKPFLLQFPDGTIEEFDTEEQACDRQREVG